MARYAAFLRGINVGGRRVKGDDLCAPFEAAGLRDVESFRASGNVIFAGDREAPAKLAARLQTALEEALGYAVVVFLRTAAEVREIAERRPFPAQTVQASDGKLQVSLLAQLPSARAQQEVLAHATPEDRLAFGKRELYWLPSGGMMESGLDLKAIEKLVGLDTRRTMGTMEQIAGKYFSDGA